MIQKILIKATDICLTFLLLWFVWYEVSYYNICLPIINMRFDSILGKLVRFFFQKDEKNTKTKKHWYTGCLYLADLQWCWKEKTTYAASRISKKIIFVWYLYVILNYRMNHSCKAYYYFNSLINWRHIINKFKYYKKTMLSLTK